MRHLVIIIALAACSVPDKQPSTGDGGADGSTPTGPIDTQITEAPAEFSNEAVATFRFTSNHPNAKFECSVDGEKAETCVSPFSKSLADGSHTFSVRATDGEGMGDESPAEHLWTIDTVAPTTTLTEAPPAIDNSEIVTFEFSSNEMNVVFECSLDNAAFRSCKSGDSFGPVGDGTHAFAVRARDRAGNVDASPAIHAWLVDTSTPDTTILSAPAEHVASTEATFTFLSPDAGPGATFECSLDGGAFVACTSPHTITGLSEGVHTFRVRVRDAGGNLDPTPATKSWRVDLTPPDTILTGGPSGTVNVASASFTFTSNEADVTFACSLDGGGMAPCTSPFTVTGLAQGAHTFAVVAIDAAGHTDPTPATASWSVDTVPPVLTIVGGPADGDTTGPRVTFMFTTSEGMTECSVDGAPYAECASPASYNLAAGAHTFSVRAVDDAENVSIITRSFTVACAAPDATGAAGLLHLDDTGQILANATGGPAATLGTDETAEAADPTPTTGRFGGALAFSPGEGDLVSWPLGAGATSSVTIELWAQPDALAGTRDVLVSGDGRIAIRVSMASETTVRFTTTFTAAGGTMFTATSQPVAAGAWHHVLVSLEEPSLRLWVDGSLATNDSTVLGSAPALDAIRLGGTFGGAIDEVYISLSATSDEVALTRYCPM
jgi:large repetitive protein